MIETVELQGMWNLLRVNSCRSWLSPQREESLVDETCFGGQCSPAGGVGKLFCKGSGIKYYRLVDQADFVATTHLCSCSVKASEMMCKQISMAVFQ